MTRDIPRLYCPRCDSMKVEKVGSPVLGTQLMKCKDCKHEYTYKTA